MPVDSEEAPPAAATFADLYRRHYAAMVRLAFLLTGGDPAAEELVQDAFLNVHRNWARADHPAAYLRTAVVNRCASWRRRRALERSRPPVPPVEAVDAHPHELADALARLPYRQRAAVVLRYYEDLPEADIARALDCRVPAVKSLLHRALRQLRTVIEP